MDLLCYSWGAPIHPAEKKVNVAHSVSHTLHNVFFSQIPLHWQVIAVLLKNQMQIKFLWSSHIKQLFHIIFKTEMPKQSYSTIQWQMGSNLKFSMFMQCLQQTTFMMNNAQVLNLYRYIYIFKISFFLGILLM